MSERSLLEVQAVSKRFDGNEVLRNVEFRVDEGEMFSILGPSGCGKTTMLRILCGFCGPDKGRILMDGKDITALPPNRRDIAMVFQNYALWPHMTVRENVSYGLRVQRLPAKILDERVNAILQTTGLREYESRFPGELSGGQQQRVALARSIVVRPRVLVMDEPLSNLDAKLREQMRTEIRNVQKGTGVTMVYVTHDQREALTMSDRIAVMAAGSVVQTGTPYELYFDPWTKFAASFIGKMNFLRGRVTASAGRTVTVKTADGEFVVNREGARRAGDTAWSEGHEIDIGFRPEIPVPGAAAANTIRGTVRDIEYGGEIFSVNVESAGGTHFSVNILAGRTERFKTGDPVVFSLPARELLVFEP